ncbi:hypothetical protein B0H14DRAFT_3466434 [Mycena olivaceomarginata]|nr:hypothetical protein B0H14DRAFT_3466434 [Mycena olivaceomarginata]
MHIITPCPVPVRKVHTRSQIVVLRRDVVALHDGADDDLAVSHVQKRRELITDGSLSLPRSILKTTADNVNDVVVEADGKYCSSSLILTCH